jgi:TRAP-type C4-dicarboxylate transport system permease small subunit
MKMLTQYEIVPSQYRIERPYDIYERDSSGVAELLALAIVGLVMIASTTLWLWFWWRLLTKAGYKGLAKGLWFILIAFPLTGGIGMVAFALVTWPIQEQLLVIKAQTQKPKDDIDEELERLKRGM